MFDDIYLPEPLYRAWPWLCLAMACGFEAIDCVALAVLMAGYATAILLLRSRD